MAFNGNEGEWINIEEGAGLTRAWRDGGNGPIKGGFLGKDKLQELLDEPGSEGIRMYFGVNEDGEKTLVCVAADADENDLLEKILDRTILCPTICGDSNSLNS